MGTLQQGLKKWADKNGAKTIDKNGKKIKQKKPAIKLSESDLRELMGTNMPIFKRAKGGAFRQK